MFSSTSWKSSTCDCTTHVVTDADFSTARLSFKAHGHSHHSSIFARPNSPERVVWLSPSLPSRIVPIVQPGASIYNQAKEKHVRALRPWSHAAIGQDQRKPTPVIGRFALNEPLPRHRTCDRTRVYTTESGGKIQLQRGTSSRTLH